MRSLVGIIQSNHLFRRYRTIHEDYDISKTVRNEYNKSGMQITHEQTQNTKILVEIG